jgi:hypothetical protein
VRKYLRDFGLAAPCGFGRAPERPGSLLASRGPAPADLIMRSIIADHTAAVATLREMLSR